MQKERALSTFDPIVLKKIIYDTNYEAREAVKAILSEPENRRIFSRDADVYLPRPQRYARALEKLRRYRQLAPLLSSSSELNALHDLLGEVRPDFVHTAMFLPTLTAQCDDEQRQRFLPLALSYQIIGTYAQTELGHGSNVRALETTATFDPATDEFVINSPHISSYKWWPGGLARTCNHALVMARLILPAASGGDMGIHPFLVPIRSMDDHTLRPGIITGDLGTKFALNHVDNGFVGFRNVRIPRRNMLMRNSQVSSSGVYSRPPNERLSFGTMVMIRSGMVRSAGSMLAKALTIAIRFAVMRQQGFVANAESSKMNYVGAENPVIDYRTTQYRLFPYIATSYALFFLGKWMWALHLSNTEALGRRDLQLLAETHAVSSGLKAYATVLVSDGVEECRRCCGGHGFADYSGLREILGVSLMNLTGEGEAFLLPLQTARFLLRKSSATPQQRQRQHEWSKSPLQAESATEYLSWNVADDDDVGTLDAADDVTMLRLLRHRSAQLFADLKQALERRVKTQMMEFEVAWQECVMLACQVSNAHCLYFTALVFRRQAWAVADVNARAALQDLFFLFCCHNIDRYAGDILRSGFLGGAMLMQIRRMMDDVLLPRIRTNAVALVVDSFDFTDLQLNSAFAENGKNLYENIIDFVLANVPENGADRSRFESEMFNAHLRHVTHPNKL